MDNKQVENIIQKSVQKYEDFWGKHNLTTRIIIFLFAFIYAFAVFYCFYHKIDAEYVDKVVEISGDIALISIIAIIIGPNSLVKIIEIIYNNKGQL